MGDPNARFLKTLQPLVEKTNEFEAEIKQLSDDGLKQKTAELKDRVARGADLDDILPEAFANVREVARRVLGQRHFDVQLLGGVVLHKGQIAEMRTGEGKTLTATAPVYLNALTGKGVHVVTVNDYLAKRDAVWMGRVYHALGMTIGCIQHESAFLFDPEYKPSEIKKANEAKEANAASEVEVASYHVEMDYLRPVSRQEAYRADITYGTNNEFGFDYLRDNMVQDLNDMVQRDLHYAIVDEVDSILIDEARTPLIISAAAEEAADRYAQFAQIVRQLKENDDYNVDEKMRAATLTDAGISRVEKILGLGNIYHEGGIQLVHHLEQALKAEVLFKLDRDYVVKDGEVIIVDEFTGRMMQGRRYSEGLHQAIEAKEGVRVQKESVTLATVTFQNYFRMYKKLAGMTGTATTSAEEFAKVYKLEVSTIPTHRIMVRKDLPDRVYKTNAGKYTAIVREVKERNAKGQPVLIGTISIDQNEVLGELLSKEGIQCNLLNAKQHEREGEIIAQAGRLGGVTVATNMAGRGVDILLGGHPANPEEAERVRAAGGLCVIGSERHEARRIDNQLRGRSGRQGDPGATQFYVSLEDDLMRIFGSDRMKNIMTKLGVPDDMPIENKMISKSIESAQQKVEGHHFDTRKHLLEYDDVMNKHREAVYRRRLEVLTPDTDYKAALLKMVEAEISQVVLFHTSEAQGKTWDLEEIYEVCHTIFPVPPEVRKKMDELKSLDIATARTQIIQYLIGLAQNAYEQMEIGAGDAAVISNLTKNVMLRAIDTLWVEHLENMTALREGVGIRGYGQRDPLVEYKREAFRMFNDLNNMIQKQVVYSFFKLAPQVTLAPTILQKQRSGLKFVGAVKESGTGAGSPSGQKVGRNDPCPCGSGKKYKKCHGM